MGKKQKIQKKKIKERCSLVMKQCAPSSPNKTPVLCPWSFFASSTLGIWGKRATGSSSFPHFSLLTPPQQTCTQPSTWLAIQKPNCVFFPPCQHSCQAETIHKQVASAQRAELRCHVTHHSGAQPFKKVSPEKEPGHLFTLTLCPVQSTPSTQLEILFPWPSKSQCGFYPTFGVAFHLFIKPLCLLGKFPSINAFFFLLLLLEAIKSPLIHLFFPHNSVSFSHFLFHFLPVLTDPAFQVFCRWSFRPCRLFTSTNIYRGSSIQQALGIR